MYYNADVHDSAQFDGSAVAKGRLTEGSRLCLNARQRRVPGIVHT